MSKPMSKTAKLCLDFANAIVAGEFEKAHSNKYLSKHAQEKYSIQSLRDAYGTMVNYGKDNIYALPKNVECNIENEDATQAWAYCSICGDGFSEAVAITAVNGLIDSIEWGRP